MAKRPFNGSPTVDGYYTTFDSSEVHRIEGPSDDHGSGGSSDFSTAQVTVAFNARWFSLGIPIVNDDYNLSVATIIENGTYTAILYKGKCMAEVIDSTHGEVSYVVTTTGEAEADEDTIIITGDCTITIS